MPSLLSVVLLATIGFAQQPEPAVSKDAISVHRVERGTMPLREAVTGSISSIAPARADVTLSPGQSEVVKPGQPCSIQIAPPSVVHGKVLRIASGPGGSTAAQIEITEPLPRAISLGDRVRGLIDVGEAKDVIFFGRPADAKPHSTAMVFVLEPDGNHARRVEVKYGRLSAALIEILGGLAEGDRVIVTDMSKWAGYERVLLK